LNFQLFLCFLKYLQQNLIFALNKISLLIFLDSSFSRQWSVKRRGGVQNEISTFFILFPLISPSHSLTTVGNTYELQKQRFKMIPQAIESKIYTLRDQQVMLDVDLATLYGVETKVLKQAIKRNIKRFPPDFMFTITSDELKILRSQIVTSSGEILRSQIATSSWGGTRYASFVFTEQGVAMLSSVLNSETAIEVNIAIMRAFVLMRQFALSHKDLTEKLKELERKYDQKFHTVHQALEYLLQKDRQQAEQPKRKQIGFHRE